MTSMVWGDSTLKSLTPSVNTSLSKDLKNKHVLNKMNELICEWNKSSQVSEMNIQANKKNPPIWTKAKPSQT
jgi:hypothetical protein